MRNRDNEMLIAQIEAAVKAAVLKAQPGAPAGGVNIFVINVNVASGGGAHVGNNILVKDGDCGAHENAPSLPARFVRWIGDGR